MLLSHIVMWKLLISDSEHFSVILEDDASISENFVNEVSSALNMLLASWDILYLGSTSPQVGGNLL